MGCVAGEREGVSDPKRRLYNQERRRIDTYTFKVNNGADGIKMQPLDTVVELRFVDSKFESVAFTPGIAPYLRDGVLLLEAVAAYVHEIELSYNVSLAPPSE
jgi:hypothetical protein